MTTETDGSKEELAEDIVLFMDKWILVSDSSKTPELGWKRKGALPVMKSFSLLSNDRNLLAEVLDEMERKSLGPNDENRNEYDMVETYVMNLMDVMGLMVPRETEVGRPKHAIICFGSFLLTADPEEILEAIYLTLKEHGDD